MCELRPPCSNEAISTESFGLYRPQTSKTKFEDAVREVILLKQGRFADVTIDNAHIFKSFKEVAAAQEDQTNAPLDTDEDAKDNLQQNEGAVADKELTVEEMGRMRAEVSFKLE